MTECGTTDGLNQDAATRDRCLHGGTHDLTRKGRPMALRATAGNRNNGPRRRRGLFHLTSWVSVLCLVGTMLAAMSLPALADPASGPTPSVVGTTDPPASDTVAPSESDTAEPAVKEAENAAPAPD